MRLQSIKRWHWMLIGALAGSSRRLRPILLPHPKKRRLGEGKMTQTEFEARAAFAAGRPDAPSN